MPITAAQKAGVLNRFFGGESSGMSAVPATWSAGLLTTAPDANGVGAVECTGGSYARVEVDNDTANFPSITSGAVKTNAIAFEFPIASASWGNVKAVGFFDALTGGNLRAWATVTPFDTPVGIDPIIQAGSLRIQML